MSLTRRSVNQNLLQTNNLPRQRHISFPCRVSEVWNHAGIRCFLKALPFFHGLTKTDKMSEGNFWWPNSNKPLVLYKGAQCVMSTTSGLHGTERLHDAPPTSLMISALIYSYNASLRTTKESVNIPYS